MTTILAFLKEPERSSMPVERLTEAYPGVTVHIASTFADAAPVLAEVDVIFSIGAHLGADAAAIYAGATKLKWVQSFGTGTDNIKGHPALPANVVVTNAHGIHGPQLSEAAFAAMLGFSRHVPQMVRNQDAARWDKPVPVLLSGKTVGVLGLGAIASDLAPRCKAFGMRTVGISSTARPVPGFDKVVSRDQLAKAVAEFDYFILLTPLSPETKHIINAQILSAMKPTAYLINLARGGVADEAALLEALDMGTIAGAALDVFETEPLPAESRFWLHPKVIVTPHAAGFHSGYARDAYGVVADNIGRYLKGGTDALINRV